ncbi:MAG: IS3 family transposase [Pseudonocardiaceae bacterium]
MSEKYELIDAEKATLTETGEKKYTIVMMCDWLYVSTSGYYEWRDRPDSATMQRRQFLELLVRTAFTESDETYGHRRVHAQLARWGEHPSPELVRAIMRDLGLVACQPRPWRHNLTESDASAGPIPDLGCRDFTAEAPGQKMVAYAQLLALVEELSERNAEQARVIAAQGEWIAELERRLAADSSNSSRPPSSDPPWDKKPARKRSARRRSDRKPGKQPGSASASRRVVEDPDETFEVALDRYARCAQSLDDAAETARVRRQVVDVDPPPPPKVTEYQLVSRRCGGCGQVNDPAATDIPRPVNPAVPWRLPPPVPRTRSVPRTRPAPGNLPPPRPGPGLALHPPRREWLPIRCSHWCWVRAARSGSARRPPRWPRC